MKISLSRSNETHTKRPLRVFAGPAKEFGLAALNLSTGFEPPRESPLVGEIPPGGVHQGSCNGPADNPFAESPYGVHILFRDTPLSTPEQTRPDANAALAPRTPRGTRYAGTVQSARKKDPRTISS